jgi:hypothetical protein
VTPAVDRTVALQDVRGRLATWSIRGEAVVVAEVRSSSSDAGLRDSRRPLRRAA